jgi:hypothetical protein
MAKATMRAASANKKIANGVISPIFITPSIHAGLPKKYKFHK